MHLSKKDGDTNTIKILANHKREHIVIVLQNSKKKDKE